VQGAARHNATVTLHATTYGENGSPIVFCHGLFGQGKNWTSIAKAFAEDHRVLLLDMPHHGRSPWSDEFDYPEMADQVADALPDEPVTLVGHSMGGKVAMVLALRHPERVERLCVVDVAPVDYGSAGEFGGYIKAMRDLDLDSLESRSQANDALTQAVPNETVRGFLLQNLRREGDDWRWQPNLEVLGEELAEVTGWPAEALGDVAPYDGQVLWVAGGDSGYITDEVTDEMDRWFPTNRRVTIKGAGHWVHSQRPEVFIEVLRRFLG
jgi:pimeloyl-ACP methyl ester carboxylesterase